MQGRKIAYWIITGLFCGLMLVSAFMYLSGNPQAVAGFAHLGYPPFFTTWLGLAKLAGVVALLAPMVPRFLREWAYAGFAITMASAAVSHANAGDPATRIIAPLIALAVLLVSRYLLPYRFVARSGA